MNLRLLCISLIACTLGIHSQLIAELTILDTEGEIRILHGNKPVLQYVKTSRPVPSGLEVIFNVVDISILFTHPRAKSLPGLSTGSCTPTCSFFAWVKSRFKGRRVDFWNQAKQLAGIEFRVFAILVVVVTRFHSQQNTTFSCDWITKKRTSFMRRGL